MDWIILVQAIKGVLLMPKIIQCTCNTPIKVYYKTFRLHNIFKESYMGIA
jgi:hypothetical protein